MSLKLTEHLKIKKVTGVVCGGAGAGAYLMKLRWTPSERWMPEQSMHRNTP